MAPEVEMTVITVDGLEPAAVDELMQRALSDAVSSGGLGEAEGAAGSRFASDSLRSLVTGEPQDAALGYIHYLKVDKEIVHRGLVQGVHQTSTYDVLGTV